MKGLGLAAGAKRPGAKKAHQRRLPPMPRGSSSGRRSTLCSRRTERAGEGTRYRRRCATPRSEESPSAAPTAPAEAAPATDAAPASTPAPDAPASAEAAQPTQPVKGLGIAKGARPRQEELAVRLRKRQHIECCPALSDRA